MVPLRMLLMALLIPALLLPEGVTFCLRQLLGERVVTRSCCASCCRPAQEARAPNAPIKTTPGATIAPERQEACCVTVPKVERSLVATNDPMRDASGEDADPAAGSTASVTVARLESPPWRLRPPARAPPPPPLVATSNRYSRTALPLRL